MEKYHQVLRDNWLCTNEQTGKHEFDYKRGGKLWPILIEEYGYGGTRIIMNRLSQKAYDARSNRYNDEHYFNSDFANQEKQRKLRADANSRRLRIEYGLRSAARLIQENASFDAYLNIALGATGAVFASANILTSPKTLGAEVAADYFILAYSLDQISDGLNTLNAIEQGVFDETKTYAVVKGEIVEHFGETGAVMCDIGGMFLGARSVYKNASKISGAQLNELFRKGIESAADITNISIIVTNNFKE